ncbi:hypothetical protein M405DRAFT_882984 [Rhizopogon salebrosus TDB-379]|nr:hypothetical protein M405DRAFT_882984 [Rhizopogon salebrosus TDB-379]
MAKRKYASILVYTNVNEIISTVRPVRCPHEHSANVLGNIPSWVHRLRGGASRSLVKIYQDRNETKYMATTSISKRSSAGCPGSSAAKIEVHAKFGIHWRATGSHLMMEKHPLAYESKEPEDILSPTYLKDEYFRRQIEPTTDVGRHVPKVSAIWDSTGGTCSYPVMSEEQCNSHKYEKFAHQSQTSTKATFNDRYQELQDSEDTAGSATIANSIMASQSRSPRPKPCRDTLWVNVEFTAHEPWIVIVLGFPIVRAKGGTERKLSGRSFLSRSPHEAFPESFLNSDGCNLSIHPGSSHELRYLEEASELEERLSGDGHWVTTAMLSELSEHLCLYCRLSDNIWLWTDKAVSIVQTSRILFGELVSEVVLDKILANKLVIKTGIFNDHQLDDENQGTQENHTCISSGVPQLVLGKHAISTIHISTPALNWRRLDQ